MIDPITNYILEMKTPTEKDIIKLMEEQWFNNRKKIRASDKLYRLGVDEMDLVELLVTIQKEYKFHLKEPESKVIKSWLKNGTVNDIIKYVLMNKKGR